MGLSKVNVCGSNGSMVLCFLLMLVVAVQSFHTIDDSVGCIYPVIETTWNGKQLDEADKIPIILHRVGPDEEKIRLLVTSRWYDDWEKPFGEKGKPYPNLWKHEVVEAFFLGGQIP